MRRAAMLLGAAVMALGVAVSPVAARAAAQAPAYPTPAGLTVRVDTASSAVMNWQPVPAAVAYRVQLQDKTTGALIIDRRQFVAEGPPTTAAAGNLAPADLYQWRVATGGTSTVRASPWSAWEVFRTTGGICAV